LFPGRDSNVRVVKVNTVSGELVQPVQHVCPLEVCSSSAQLGNSKMKMANPSILASDTHVPDASVPGASLCYSIREDRKHTDPISPINAVLLFVVDDFSLRIIKGENSKGGRILELDHP